MTRSRYSLKEGREVNTLPHPERIKQEAALLPIINNN
jgi:hypothetical protein